MTRSAEGLTPLELAIMKVLWEGGDATVQQVREALAPERELAYNTVQTMLNVLCRKGRAVRERGEGRAFVYASAVSRGQASRAAIADLIHRMFDGSAENLVSSLVEARHLTPETLARLARKLEQLEKAEEEGRRGEP